MHRPDSYRKVNLLQRNDAKMVMDACNKEHLKWPSTGLCTVLDIGCGTGDVTHDILLPALPGNFIKLDAIDISAEMVEYGKANYKHPHLKFHQLDITTNDIQTFIADNGQYDFIFSFYCIHWIQDQLHLLTNIYNLLQSNGQIVITLSTRCSLYDAYDALAINPKWSSYLTDVKRYLPVYRFLPNPTEIELEIIAKQVGFKNVVIKGVPKIFDFDNEIKYRDFLSVFNPFIHRIPIEQHEEFITEMIDFIRKRDNLEESSLQLHYFALVTYMQK